MAVECDPGVAAARAEGEEHYGAPASEASVVKVALQMVADGEILERIYIIDRSLCKIRAANKADFAVVT